MNCSGKEREPYSKDIEDFIKEYLNADFMKNYLRDRLNNFTVTFETFQKPNNNAPKSIKGDYDLSIHGNKIVLVDKNEGTIVEAKCHPDDDFDIGTGIKEAFKKMNEKREEIRKAKEEEEKKIKVGDWVEVIRPNSTYPMYTDFFEKNNLSYYGKIFRYGTTVKEGTVGKVVFILKDYIVIKSTENFGNYGERDCTYLVSPFVIRKVVKPQ